MMSIRPSGITAIVKSPHWGLNPGPSVYKTDALPLSYRGHATVEFGKHREHQLWKVWDCLRIALDKLLRLAAAYDGAFESASVEL